MGELKFEKDFSEKLNKRKIVPKAGSWTELSARLNSEEKSKNPMFWWIGIAATIVGGILIFSVLFNEPISENPIVVDAPSKVIFKDKSEPLQISSEKLASEELKSPEKASEKPAKTLISKKEPVINLEPSAMANAMDSTQKKNDRNEQDPDLKVKTKISGIHEEMIAEASLKGIKTGNVTDAEVDALLAEATDLISRERSANPVSENIDADALLFNAEMELEQSFREKVFVVLKESYLKAKTSVANRNN